MDQKALAQEMHKRRERVKRIASTRGFDATLVIGRAPDRAGDMRYLCGNKPYLSGHISRYGYRGRGFGALLLPTDSGAEPTLVCTTPFYIPPIDVEDIVIDTHFSRGLASALEKHGLSQGNIGLVGVDILSVLLYQDLLRLAPGARFVEADDVVTNLRAVKSEFELSFLRTGAQIADEVAELVREAIRPGVSERDIGTLIVSELSKRGVAGAFATCQSGPVRSNEPYWDPAVSDRVFEAGDLVHMEINGSYGGYMIDICRSTVVGGVGDKQREILEVTLRILEESIAAIKPWMPAEDLEAVAGEIARQAGYEKNFTVAYGGAGTYLGHGIGLGSDEPPLLAKGDKTPLEPGMILTIEPGIYRTDVGGARIEDEVLVTEEGAEVLNKSSRRWW
jgi:Xaa-Pro aminopeptidase